MVKSQKRGKFLDVPYDWRKPTRARLRTRIWNPDAPLVTPKWCGWGFDVNFYRLLHPNKSRGGR
ncbi:MAG TPA: hypothetical protein VGM08_01470 [Candidatus Saccharimonadales bacterium]|jgi:hypothetical protein